MSEYRHVDEIERLRDALEKASQSFWAIRKLCPDGGPVSDEAIRALREIEHMPRGLSGDIEPKSLTSLTITRP